MFDATDRGIAGAVTSLTAGVDGLLADDLVALSSDEMLGVLRAVEVQRRRLEAVDQRLIAEAETRKLALDTSCGSTADLLSELWVITMSEARRRIRAAADLGPRRSLTGQRLPPIFERVAAASAVGEISAAQAKIVITTIDELPDAIRAEKDVEVEAALVGHARTFEPLALQKLATRYDQLLNPDGKKTEAAERERRRGLRLYTRRDGSSRIEGDLTAIATETTRAVFDILARPRPAIDGEKDPRTVEQRRHDAWQDAMLLALRSGQLPDSGGISTTMLFVLDAQPAPAGTDVGALTGAGQDDRGVVTDHGLALTGHGALIPAGTALRHLGDARTQTVLITPVKGIEAYSDTRRLFTEQQRLAMAARDKGCAFPGCSAPPARCQAAHMTDFVITRRTSVDDGALLCGYHHREYESRGWTPQMINGFPHFIPPPWIDPQQTPRRNYVHDPRPQPP